MKKIICIIGGDERNYELANILKEGGFEVRVYGEDYLDINTFLVGADIVVSGIPFSRDGETINAPNILEKISVKELFSNMKEVKRMVAGSILPEIKELATRYDIETYDFLDDEDFAVYNAIPTAEGAIEIAMRNIKSTINSSNCLVLGYGRIGKVLADILNGMHANTTVVARKNQDFAWVKAMGYSYINYSELSNVLPCTDILFNTVPALIIKKDEIDCMKKDCVIIDLASKPGGVDFEYAKEKGIKAELALGLPGKVAPKSVAEYMLNKVTSFVY